MVGPEGSPLAYNPSPMFDRLQDRIAVALKKLARQGRLGEAEVVAGLREIRLALLEADVSLPVAKDFISRIRPKAIGSQVLDSLTPVEQLVKIVYEELTEMLGGEGYDPKFILGTGRSVFMLVGLQGGGKTTTAAKLANRFKSEGKKPLLVAADLARPAAADQLEVLGKQVHTAVYRAAVGGGESPVDVARNGVLFGEKESCSPIIVDTAGRLAIDEALMAELVEIRDAVKPDEILLVLDAMTGQDAVETAKRFDEQLGITGLVLTKMDGDARGGAALSMRAVTGKPIRMVGVGEKIDALEYFHPERVAGRILGRGDMASLMEKAAGAFSEDETRRFEKKLRKGHKFNLEDFLVAMRQTQKLGSMKQLLAFIPGLKMTEEQMEAGKMELAKFESIIHSMTKGERQDPRLLNASRRKRIARGSGRTVQDINRFMAQFRQMQQMAQGMFKQAGKLR